MDNDKGLAQLKQFLALKEIPEGQALIVTFQKSVGPFKDEQYQRVCTSQEALKDAQKHLAQTENTMDATLAAEGFKYLVEELTWKKLKTFYVVTATAVKFTGKISFGFIYEVDMPEFTRSETIALPFGAIIWDKEKNPPDGKIILFKSGEQVLYMGDASLKEMAETADSCVILVQRDLLDELAQACEELEDTYVDIIPFHYDGTLQTSSNNRISV